MLVQSSELVICVLFMMFLTFIANVSQVIDLQYVFPVHICNHPVEGDGYLLFQYYTSIHQANDAINVQGVYSQLPIGSKVAIHVFNYSVHKAIHIHFQQLYKRHKLCGI